LPRRSALKCRRRYCCAPTRSSNNLATKRRLLVSAFPPLLGPSGHGCSGRTFRLS
jgi:hypothetical protein